MRIALTGGIACGKSLVTKYLNDLGVETLDADDIVHELIPDPAERRRIAAEVFADKKARRRLEARIHPLVKGRIEQWMRDGAIKVAVVPLLFEAHWEENFDIICCVKSEEATQVARMMTMRGYTREEAESRLAAQLPVAEKVAKSHYVINNDGSPKELKEEAERFVRWLKSLMCSRAR